MKNKLQVLISTMNLKNDMQVDMLLKNMRIKTDYIIINQTKNKSYVNIQNKNVKTIEGYGLSSSRNLAIKNATSNIIILADDDLTYVDNYAMLIEEEYAKDNDVDIICFWVESKNINRKIRKLPNGKVGYIKLMRICSFQISMRRDRIKKINFDERFGAKALYNRGEENIFLCDCLRHGLKIKFVNKKIGEVKQNKSTWYEGYSKEYFKVQGIIYRRMYPKWHRILILQFVIRKYPEYRKKVKFIEALREMNNNKD